ncbi:imelysin family protein [Specibacter sp. RAF43]|uniref:imelysin family protein n=1 Tax=Specibacter sp. RAF43 TaxID=3233057 RepID=UPI003F9DA413
MSGPAALRREWIATGLAVAVSAALIAGVSLTERTAPGPSMTSAATTVTITDRACGSGVANRVTGPASFMVRNAATWPTEVYLVKLPEFGTLIRTVTLGPGSSVTFNATIGPGDYAFQCLQSGQLKGTSAPFVATGPVPANATPAVRQASTGELGQSNNLYLKHASRTLVLMLAHVRALTTALLASDVPTARRDWLLARQTWSGLGAAYGSFGEAGDAIEGVRDPASTPDRDTGFTGLGRIEYGLFNGQPAPSLALAARRLESDVASLAARLPTLAMVPGALSLRAHEILEDTLRDTLSGQDNHGAAMAFAITSADVAATRSTVADLATPLESRRPGLVAAINARLDAVDAQLTHLRRGDSWVALDRATTVERQHVNGAVSAALEVLADIPQLLALPQGSE